MKRIFCINSLNKRSENLDLIIPNILNQADIIHVNLIGYNHTPPVLSNDKIIIKHLTKGGSELRFMYYNQYKNDYYFTIDDDILYPVDYSDILIDNMVKHENNAVCCVHGSNINLTKNKMFWEGRRTYHFTRKLEEEKKIMVPGVGTTCFNTSTLKINMEDFKFPNISDAYISTFLKKQNIQAYSIIRNDMWLIPLDEFETRIWGNNNHKEIDKLITKHFKVSDY